MYTENNDKIEKEKTSATKKSTNVSIVVNSVLSTLQIIVGFLSNSQGLIADGIHSISDLLSDFVVLLALKHSQKKPDDDHHFGHQRYEDVARLILGVILTIVGAGMIYSAIRKIATPELITNVDTIAIYIAILAIITKEILFRYMIYIANKVKSSLLVANAWHARSDAASSLIVTIGIFGSLMGIELLDPIAALIVGGVIFKMGWTFTYDSIMDLADRAADEQEVKKIVELIQDNTNVLGIHDIRTRKSGDYIHFNAHIELDQNLSILEGHNIVEDVTKKIIEKFNVIDVLIHVDPVEKYNE